MNSDTDPVQPAPSEADGLPTTSAFRQQYEEEAAVWRRAGLLARSVAEHALFVMGHRRLFGGRHSDEVIEGAALVVEAAGLVPSRWRRINEDEPGETALWECTGPGCGTKSKWPGGPCKRRCTDMFVAFGHDPLFGRRPGERK